LWKGCRDGGAMCQRFSAITKSKWAFTEPQEATMSSRTATTSILLERVLPAYE